jgi:hypothetical protein
LFAVLFLSLCVSLAAAPTETSLVEGVGVNGTTTKDQAVFFSFTLKPYEDAELTLTMYDGDADIYVLGPSYPPSFGFGPGPEGGKATNVDTFNAYTWEWSSFESSGTDEIVYISSASPNAGLISENRTFRVGVWGWSRWGERGGNGSAWSARYETRDHASMVNRPDQRDAMRALFTECCGANAKSSCVTWRNASKLSSPADACHVRGNVCDPRGVLKVLSFRRYGMSCDLAALVAELQASVLRTVVRIDLEGNPRMTTGNVNSTKYPGAALTPAETLVFFLRATSLNVTHVHLETGTPGGLFTGIARDSANTFTEETCGLFRDRAHSLESFKASKTGLKGSFPLNEACVLGRAMKNMKLGANALIGAVPEPPPIGGCPHLLFFTAERNGFEGSIPTGFATSAPSLVVLDLSENAFSGAIPSLGARTKQDALLFFRAKNNALTGPVPDSLLGAYSGLSVLDLKNNRLSGSLPRDAFAGARLVALDLRRNALSGALPNVMSPEEAADESKIVKDADGVSVAASASARLLRYVDLAENAFEGYGFPDALVAAPDLTFLYLENNALTGALPLATNGDQARLEFLIRFRNTRVFSIARNRITGSIPDDHLLLETFEAPPGKVLDADSGEFVDVQHVYDVSENRLTGLVPSWLSMFENYRHVTVDVSGNDFSCPIPNSLRYMALRCSDAGSNDPTAGNESGAFSGRKVPGTDGGIDDGVSILSGIQEKPAYAGPASATSTAEPKKSDDSFLGLGTLETAAGAGALFAALLTLSLLAHAAFRARLVRRNRRAQMAEMLAESLDDIDAGRRGNAWGDVEMTGRRTGGGR